MFSGIVVKSTTIGALMTTVTQCYQESVLK